MPDYSTFGRWAFIDQLDPIPALGPSLLQGAIAIKRPTLHSGCTRVPESDLRLKSDGSNKNHFCRHFSKLTLDGQKVILFWDSFGQRDDFTTVNLRIPTIPQNWGR